MIVPSPRLIFWTGMIVIPFSALAAALPSSYAISAVPICLLLAVASADAMLARRAVGGMRVEFPGMIRMWKGRPGAIEFVVRTSGRHPRALRLGLTLPPELLSVHEALFVELPLKGGQSFEWPCTPLKRGRYLFRESHLECPSPLGLWAARRTTMSQFEVRVYPDLSRDRRHLAAIFLRKGNFGVHSHRHVGTGRDFEKLREYIHGDSYEHIHWKATAKRGYPVTKVFQIERTQEVYLIIDASRLSSRPAGVHPEGGAEKGKVERPVETALERYIAAALVMGAAAERQGDLFGVLTFSDRVLKFIRAKNGKAHYHTCRDALYTLQPRAVAPDFDELCSFIGLKLRRRALLIFLTGLDDPALAGSFVRNMDLICRKHLVLVNMLKPSGVQPLFSDDPRCVDDIYRHLGGHMLWHSLLELQRVLHHRGVRFTLLGDERFSAQLVSQYMNVKQGQLL